MIQLRFDARQIKSEVNQILKHKVRGITTNTELYDNLLEGFYAIVIQPSLYKAGYDTGAFSEARSGISEKSGYFRHGYKTISPHHGIERDAIEERPKGDRHYFAPVFRRVFGIEEANGAEAWDAVQSSIKNDYLKYAKREITRSMNNEQK